MNISNPGPVESWQEVLAQHARDQLTSATAVKARGGLNATARLDLPAAPKHAWSMGCTVKVR